MEDNFEASGADADSQTDNKSSNPSPEEVPEYDLEMLRRLREDLKHTHTETLQTFTDLSGAAGRLLGFTGTTLAVIAAAAALANNLASVINLWNTLGFSLIIMSAVITLIGHRSRKVTTGLSRGELERALAVVEIEPDELSENVEKGGWSAGTEWSVRRRKLKVNIELEKVLSGEDDGYVEYAPSEDPQLNEPQYLTWISRNYMRWITDALEENAEKSRELFYSRLMYSIGLLLLIVGTFLPAYRLG